MRAARRRQLVGLGHRGSTVGVAARDGPACAHARVGRFDEVGVIYRARSGRSKVTGHCPGHAAGHRRHGGAPPMTAPGVRALAQGSGLAEVQVVVIAKEPRPGTVKTRLCPPLTPRQAASVAAAALADTLEVVAGTELQCRVRWPSRVGPVPGCRRVDRRGAAHGSGSASASRAPSTTLGRSTRCPVLLIGMDTPQLDTRRFESAAARVCSSPGVDTVLGPADDGGYWLIGTRGAGARHVRRRSDEHRSHGRRATPTAGHAGLDLFTVCPRSARCGHLRRRPRGRESGSPHSAFAATLRACAQSQRSRALSETLVKILGPPDR